MYEAIDHAHSASNCCFDYITHRFENRKHLEHKSKTDEQNDKELLRRLSSFSAFMSLSVPFPCSTDRPTNAHYHAQTYERMSLSVPIYPTLSLRVCVMCICRVVSCKNSIIPQWPNENVIKLESIETQWHRLHRLQFQRSSATTQHLYSIGSSGARKPSNTHTTHHAPHMHPHENKFDSFVVRRFVPFFFFRFFRISSIFKRMIEYLQGKKRQEKDGRSKMYRRRNEIENEMNEKDRENGTNRKKAIQK